MKDGSDDIDGVAEGLSEKEVGSWESEGDLEGDNEREGCRLSDGADVTSVTPISSSTFNPMSTNNVFISFFNCNTLDA